MKKGIIAISLLLTATLLITPITNAITKKEAKENVKHVKMEQATNNENITTQINKESTFVQVETKVVENKVNLKEEVKIDNKKEESRKEENTKVSEEIIEEDKNQEKTGMSKSEAEAVLNKYIDEVEESDFTYAYQGDENTFESIKNKGIKGYVFLPNLETDIAYLVDKDSGNIYFFHPSGYFELLQ